jgi:hypothetical protein
MTNDQIGPSLLAALARVPDVRSHHGRRYPLSALLTLATVAMLAGARSLSAPAKAVIADGSNEILLNVASLWEMAIKMSLGEAQHFRPVCAVHVPTAQVANAQKLSIFALLCSLVFA